MGVCRYPETMGFVVIIDNEKIDNTTCKLQWGMRFKVLFWERKPPLNQLLAGYKCEHLSQSDWPIVEM